MAQDGVCHGTGRNPPQEPGATLTRSAPALKLPPWEPTRHGKSGDWRMEELFKLPVEARAEALYGTPVTA